MYIKIITVGSPQLSFAKKGIEEYTKRLSGFVQTQLVHVKENKQTEQKILKEIGTDFCVLLDEGGSLFSSHELADFLEQKTNHSQNCCFIIGAADGHTSLIRQRADMLWSLSPLTFPHDIATLLLSEALYRGYSLLRGHPYHRD